MSSLIPRSAQKNEPSEVRLVWQGLLGRCLCAWTFLVAALVHSAEPVATMFNEAFLELGGGQADVDLSMFAFGSRVLAGEYRVDVLRNDDLLGRFTIRFIEHDAGRDAVPCLSAEQLVEWGLNLAALPAMSSPPPACIDLEAAYPEARVAYDAAAQRLRLSIPQAALSRKARGSIDSSRWDSGIDAALFDYQLSLARNDEGRAQGGSGNTLFGRLRGGINLGSWRLRQYFTYNRDSVGQGSWQAGRTYVQRDIQALNGQLMMGDGYTLGELFEGFQFRGVQLSSDEAMLPDSLRAYAPTIRGVAQSNARVVVRQNGFIIYSAYVAPGPFTLDDLYPTTNGGDLDVTILEADGRQVRYSQAFSSVPTLLRDGRWRYEVSAGEYRTGYEDEQLRPYFFQGTLARGLSGDFSLYGGALLGQGYQAGLLGIGRNMLGFGALSLDLSDARTCSKVGCLSGQALRVLYGKTLERTATTFSMTGYRYSGPEYYSFPEAVQMQALEGDGLSFPSVRSELQVDLSQSMGRWGALFVSARQQRYWGSNDLEHFVQLGYSGSYRQLSYNLYYNQYRTLFGAPERQLMISVSIPLGSSGASGMYSVSRGADQRLYQQASVFGNALDDHRLDYGVTFDRSDEQGSRGSLNLGYQGRYGQVDFGHSQGQGYEQTNLELSGGMVAHANGLTLSQPLGETVALVQVPDAEGLALQSQVGVRTDGRGYAVVPSLTPYRSNRLSLSMSGLGENVEVMTAAQEVVPTRGAVVLAPFEARSGYRLMLRLSDAQGEPLPFGARIVGANGQELGLVGPEGLAYVAGAEPAGKLNVRWGAGRSCTVAYRVPPGAPQTPVRGLKESCL
ncbi:fimbria/pilus outer membrane usher protein [Pseudomonas sp. zjy_8]